MKIFKKLSTICLIVAICFSMFFNSISSVSAIGAEGVDVSTQAFQTYMFSTSPNKDIYYGDGVISIPADTHNGNNVTNYRFTVPWQPYTGDIKQTRACMDGLGNPSGGTQTGDIKTRIRSDPSTGTQNKDITYSVAYLDENGTKRITRVVAQVISYTVKIEIYIRPQDQPFLTRFWERNSLKADGTCAPAMWDTAIWFRIKTSVWDACVDPVTGAYSNNSFNIPLSFYLQNLYTVPNQDSKSSGLFSWTKGDGSDFDPSPEIVGKCVSLTEPQSGGDYWTLYSKPTLDVPDLSDPWHSGNPGQDPIYALPQYDLSSNLIDDQPNLSPFRHFNVSNEGMWFKVGFSKLIPYIATDSWGQMIYAAFPSVGFVGKMWYLKLGEFIYEESEADKPVWTWVGWTQVFGPGHWMMDSISGFLGMLNPFRIFGPFQGLVESIFWILIFGFGLWILIKIWNKVTRGKANPYDYLRDIRRGAGAVRRGTGSTYAVVKSGASTVRQSLRKRRRRS